MKLLQVVVAVLTILMFLVRQNVFCRVASVKKISTLPGYCLNSHSRLSSTSERSRGLTAGIAKASDEDVFMPCPKYKKDPKISVDNEDIDYRPLD